MMMMIMRVVNRCLKIHFLEPKSGNPSRNIENLTGNEIAGDFDNNDIDIMI